MARIKLWGFDGSTYVRTVKIVLAEKGVSDYEQVPIDVLKGEPKSDEHRARHPFGKVPVLDHDGFRVIETPAICQYLETVLPGRSVIPTDPQARAKTDMWTSIVDAYTYDPVVGGVVGYHLFPDFVGGKDEAAHKQGIEDARKAFEVLMAIKGDSPFAAGEIHGLGDYYLAPLMAYIAQTPHLDEFLALHGVGEWWQRMQGLESFKTTAS